MNKSKLHVGRNTIRCAIIVLSTLTGGWATAQTLPGKSGTTLAATKTLDICAVSPGIWRYSGEIAVWNSGAVDTQGLVLNDVIQNKVSGPTWTTAGTVFSNYLVPEQIKAGTTQATATTYKYSIDLSPLAGSIRNAATVKITNHSGAPAGTLVGPEPKATWTGGTPPPCENSITGCAYSQGYWGTHANWPVSAGFTPASPFYISGLTYQQILDSNAKGGNAYVKLGFQFIAATLNQATGASVPASIQQILTAADGFFQTATLTSCGPGQCGDQETWAGMLDDYNNGRYPGGPPHCGS